MQRYLRKRFGPNLATRILWRVRKDPRTHSKTLAAAAQARTHKDRYFVGHFSFGMHRHLPSPATYLTFLRDPVQRVISLYKYSREHSHAYYHKQARSSGLEEFCLRSGLLELDNGMVRFIRGAKDEDFVNRTPFGLLERDDLETAKRNLDHHFFFLGLQERFDESFLLLAKYLGDRQPRYLRLNEAKSSKKEESIKPEVVDAIRQNNLLDLELYEYAQNRLNRDLAESFVDLEQELSLFEARNAAFNKRVGRLYRLSRLTRAQP